MNLLSGMGYHPGMEGITTLNYGGPKPVLVWDTTRYSYMDDPSVHAKRLKEVIEERASTNLFIFCPHDELEIVQEISWIMSIFDFRVFTFVMSGPNPLPLYRKATLEGKWINNHKRPWVPVEMLSLAIGAAVKEEAEPGLYPFMGVPFQLSTLARELGLPGKPFDERAKAVQWSQIPYSIKVHNENAFSYENQRAFWLAYSEAVQPFEPNGE